MRRFLLITMIGMFAHSGGAEDAVSDDATSLQSATRSEAVKSSREPIPQDDVPTELKRMIEDGRVEVVYDSDEDFCKVGRGWADFFLKVDRSFRFRSQVTTRQTERHFQIVITKIEPRIGITHLIRIPATYRSREIWTSRLLRHEFDHVALSVDPRPALLIKRLLSDLKKIDHRLERDETPSQELADKLINAELDRRIEAVRALMISQNKRLDRLTQHGTITLPRRAEFFQTAYDKSGLAESQFSMLDSILPLLESPAYRDSAPRALAIDPTVRWMR